MTITYPFSHPFHSRIPGAPSLWYRHSVTIRTVASGRSHIRLNWRLVCGTPVSRRRTHRAGPTSRRIMILKLRKYVSITLPDTIDLEYMYYIFTADEGALEEVEMPPGDMVVRAGFGPGSKTGGASKTTSTALLLMATSALLAALRRL